MKIAARPCMVLLALFLLSACGGLRYSQVAREAKDFHPQKVAVLPADVGTYEEARGIVEQIVAGVLVDKKWFTDVVDAATIVNQLQSNEDYRRTVLDYLVKLKTINVSDSNLSKKIGETSQVDAFIVINVDFWNYTRENDKKFGKVGLGIKMVEASTGRIMWKAGHHEAESYMLFRPDLADVAEDLIKTMVGEMPR
ncbi:MAG: hypothetical protein NTW71_11575 [Deltaproteobacteria bacterium]|nr:hypothetical protein [Deltaproteobacteria bacterium]